MHGSLGPGEQANHPMFQSLSREISLFYPASYASSTILLRQVSIAQSRNQPLLQYSGKKRQRSTAVSIAQSRNQPLLLLAATSEISGISQERLLVIARRLAVTTRDTKWYDVLSTIYSFYRINASLDNEK